MDAGNVPEVTGTGLRQIAGALSVTDLSGNNLLTVTSVIVALGNTTDNPPVSIFGTGGLNAQGLTSGAQIDLSPDAGSFTATYSGFSSPVSGPAQWLRIGRMAMLYLGAASGASNSNQFALTNVPTQIRTSLPAFTVLPAVCFLNNGSTVAGVNEVSFLQSGPNVGFALDSNSLAWSVTGVKGIINPLVVTYLL